MIKTETFYIGEQEFVRTYSDANRYVVRDGEEYEEACDPVGTDRTYTEGDLLPEPDPQYLLDILLGGAI